MKKLLLLLLLITSYSFAQQAYYSDVNLTLTGTALRDELATKIISTHTNLLSYSEIWESSKITDLDPDDTTNSNVLLIYGYSDTDGNYVTDRTRNKNLNGGSAGTEWNREHSYPKSLGNPNLGTSGPGSDAHHLRPSDITFNGQRGSLKFATGSGTAGGSNGGWYPGEEWKGDVARMMMYMYLRYGSQCYPSGVAIGTTNAVDSNMIDLLLDWNAADPVSQVEDNRNSYHGNTSNTYAQGNRNPFIDNPNLATQIWGGTPAEDRWNVTPDTENPTAPTDLAGTNITNTSIDLTWTASTDNVAVTSYEIYVNDGGGDVLSGTSSTTSTTLTGLTINTTYDITVYAIDAAENISASSNVLNITTTNIIDTTAPSIPTNIIVSNETSTSIDISWTASTDDQAVKEYDIYIDGSYNATSIATTFTVDGLTASTTYSFSVLARDTSDNDSALSVAVDGTTTATPSYCGSETFTNITTGSTSYETRTWTGDGGGSWSATGARTDQTLTGPAITIRNGALTAPTTANGIGDLTVTTKLIYGGTTGTFDLKVNGVVVGTIPNGIENEVITTTIAGINISGNVTIVIDNSSNTSNRVIFDDLSWSCFASSDTEAPSTISDLSASNITSTSADLSWTAATDNVGVTYYEIFKDGVFLASSPTNTYAVSGLTASTSYDFTVYAKDAAGNTSLVSNTETFTTLAGSSTTTNIFFQGFEGTANDTWSYGITPTNCNNGGNDVWDVVSSVGSISAANTDTNFFGVRDLEGSCGTADGGTISFGEVSLSGYTDVTLTFAINVVGYDVSNGDIITYEIFHDNVSQGVVTVTSGTTYSTTDWEEISVAIPNSVSTVKMDVYVKQNGGTDYAGIDDVQLVGTDTSALSVQEFVKNLFKVYPNPTKTNSVTIAVNNNESIKGVQLYNLIGQLIVDHKNIGATQNKIEIQNIPSGFYIVKVFNDTTYSIKRLIVE